MHCGTLLQGQQFASLGRCTAPVQPPPRPLHVPESRIYPYSKSHSCLRSQNKQEASTAPTIRCASSAAVPTPSTTHSSLQPCTQPAANAAAAGAPAAEKYLRDEAVLEGGLLGISWLTSINSLTSAAERAVQTCQQLASLSAADMPGAA
jgi:hypothetical protein